MAPRIQMVRHDHRDRPIGLFGRNDFYIELFGRPFHKIKKGSTGVFRKIVFPGHFRVVCFERESHIDF